jgi:DNA helicase IV
VSNASGADLAAEQAYVTTLYERLDALRERASGHLSTILHNAGGTPQARTQREWTAHFYQKQIQALNAVENGLCFGRLEFGDGARRYVGRIGLSAEKIDPDTDEPLLVDWRARAARPFYVATAASPDGVRVRRHLRTDDRRVLDVDDEVLDLADPQGHPHDALNSEAALLAALNATRTGHMQDIVRTIQAEQDTVIRAPIDGVLVVQGGPGTGKTAVALHRAAYLMYTHRDTLTKRGVLIVGPNPAFLSYISHVLPSLAETGVLLATLGDLFPGTPAHDAEPAEVAELKGRPVMVEILAAAVADRQRLPETPVPLKIDGETLLLHPHTIADARAAARATGRPHNLARPTFENAIVDALTQAQVDRLGADPLGGEENLMAADDITDLRKELASSPEVLGTVDWLWPVLRPQQLVAGLFATEHRLAAAAPMLSPADRALLARRPGPWTPADVPLLDEAAELLGTHRVGAIARADRQRLAEISYAQGVLDIYAGSASQDADIDEESEFLSAGDVIDAASLAQRQEDIDYRTAAERAAADRTWAFGHVIVDEAQELSPMAWRLLMRRSPNRSMTLVGDIAQTGALGGAASWQSLLGEYVAERWNRTELTVGYRTPAEVMAVAAAVLAEISPDLRPPRSVRNTGTAPWADTVDLAGVADLVARWQDAHPGQLGVIAPAGRLAELGHLGTVRTVAQCKGLEFDSVIVVDPAGILAESPRGRNDLYVALTRATQRLAVLQLG